MRAGTLTVTLALAGVAALYPVAIEPGSGALLTVELLALVVLVLAVAIPSWALLVTGMIVTLAGYAVAAVADRGAIDVTAPLFGLVLVFLIESFDARVAADPGRAIERPALRARMSELMRSVPVALAGGVVVLFAGVYGGDGGVLLAGIGSGCVVAAFWILVRVARPDP